MIGLETITLRRCSNTTRGKVIFINEPGAAYEWAWRERYSDLKNGDGETR